MQNHSLRQFIVITKEANIIRMHYECAILMYTILYQRDYAVIAFRHRVVQW